MGRNLFRRIEIAWPVLEPKLKKRVIDEGLRVYLEDKVDAWELNAAGVYRRKRGAKAAPCAQSVLLERVSAGVAPG
jgi:polyphosphate kinase